MVKRKLIIFILFVSLLLMSVSIGSFAFNVVKPVESNEIGFKMGSLKGDIVFSTTENIKGIPGEEMPLSKENYVVKENKSIPMAFKVVYEIESPEAQKIVSSLDLKDYATDFTIIKDESQSTPTKLVFYGLLKGDGQIKKDLGTLYVKYNFLGNEFSAKNFNVNTTFIGCQQTESAIKELLKIDPTGQFAALLN